MESLYGKQYVFKKEIGEIVHLFATNYKNYHYKQLCSIEELEMLLADKEFNCVCLVDNDRVCGFAGYYVKEYIQTDVKEIILAHLLVDNKFRGKGYGKVLEDCRMKMISKIHGKKVIYASCVEKPLNSVDMKEKREFITGGFRYQYRPGISNKENAVVMVKADVMYRNITVEEPCLMTKRLIGRYEASVIYSKVYGQHPNLYIHSADKKIGRQIYSLTDEKKGGYELSDKLLKRIKYRQGYISIHVNPGIEGFAYADNILINNSFYPMCYIPYIRNGFGIIEYQCFFEELSTLIRDKDICAVSKKLINYIAFK